MIPETLPTTENKNGGILLVTMPGYGPATLPAKRSFFGDKEIDQGNVLNRFVEWFDLWGLTYARQRGKDGAFERSFFTLEWPRKTIENAHGPQLVPKIALEASDLLNVIKEREPRIIIFLSNYLWQAVNVAQELFIPTLGNPRGPGRRVTSERLSAYIQPWEKATLVALPMPSKNTTEKFITSLAQPMQQLFASYVRAPEKTLDPLLLEAQLCLAFDKEASIQAMRGHLHVTKERAEKLFASLNEIAYRVDAAGRFIKISK